MVTGMGAAFQIRKGEKEFLGPRRGGGFVVAFGGAKSPEGDGRYACPAGAPYQNALGAAPQDPLTLKLRLDTNWIFQQMLKSRSAQRRRYALKVPAAHFILDFAGTELK